MWLRQGIGLIVIGLLCGCTTGTVTPTGPRSVAFLPSEAADRTLLQSLAKRIELLLETCAQQNTCEEIYFTRGLLALYEDREVAAASFREVLRTSPAGPLVLPSTRWLQLLSEEAPAALDVAFAENTKAMVQLWVSRMTAQAGVACESAVEAPQKPDPLLQVLQRRIQARDRRITELSDQLRALKQIDLDGHVKRKTGPPRKIQAEK